jgi:hypothetical protein
MYATTTVYVQIEIRYVDVALLSYNAVWTCRSIPTFLRSILPPSSTLKSTRRYNPGQHRHLHRRENLKSHIIFKILLFFAAPPDYLCPP